MVRIDDFVADVEQDRTPQKLSGITDHSDRLTTEFGVITQTGYGPRGDCSTRWRFSVALDGLIAANQPELPIMDSANIRRR